MASAIKGIRALQKQLSLVEEEPDNRAIWLYIGKPQKGDPGHLTLGDLRKLIQWFEQ